MNTRDRYLAVMNFEEVDRTLLWEFGYWAATVRRWYREGLPLVKGIPDSLLDRGVAFGESAGAEMEHFDFVTADDVHNYFHLDPGVVLVPLNAREYPPYEEKILEDHGEYIIYQSRGGAKHVIRKDTGSLFDYTDPVVTGRESWEQYKAERLRPDVKRRLPDKWPQLVESYKTRDYPLSLGFIPGFFGFTRSILGDTNQLTMYYRDPDLMRDMTDYLADFYITLFAEVLKDVKVDSAFFLDDICYKKGPIISPAFFREFIMPGYKKVTGLLRDYGVNIVIVDCDGNLNKVIPLYLESGVNVFSPVEVQAGMDVREIRKAFPKLGLIGGLDKSVLARDKQAIDDELESKVPFMLKHGGYIPLVDHFVQPNTSFDNYTYFRRKLEQIIRNNK